MLVRKEGRMLEAINRSGLITGIPSSVASDALDIPGDLVIDGEVRG